MGIERLSEGKYTQQHDALMQKETRAIAARLGTMRKELREAIDTLLKKKPSQSRESPMHHLGVALYRVEEQLQKTRRMLEVDGTQYNDPRLQEISQKLGREKTLNDTRRLGTMLDGMSPHTQKVTMSPLEFERLTLDYNDRSMHWHPMELLQRRVLVPYTELINYRCHEEVPLRVCPIAGYKNHQVALQRTGADSEKEAALFRVDVFYGADTSHPHPFSFSVPSDQEELWLLLLDEQLRNLVRTPLSRFRSDPLGSPQRGEMKFPLVKVREGKNLHEFQAMWPGAG